MQNKGIPIMYDLGQGLPMFEKSEVLNFIDQGEWIILTNTRQALSEITGLNKMRSMQKFGHDRD